MNVRGRGQAAPREGVTVLQPEFFIQRRKRVHPALRYRAGQPLEGGQHGKRRSRRVAEGREDLLESIERLVRYFDGAPVMIRLVFGQAFGKPFELCPGQGTASIQLFFLAIVDAHRDRQNPDISVVVPLVDVPGDRGCSFDALVAQGETVNQDVREMDRADICYVGQPGPAVYESIVVILLHIRAQGVEELAAAEPFVEVIPVNRCYRRGIVAILAARRDEFRVPPSGKAGHETETACLSICA